MHGWSQEEAAKRYNAKWHPERPLAGKHISYWEMWPSKSGKEPPLSKLRMLADVYECSLSDLLANVGQNRRPARTCFGPSAGADSASPPQEHAADRSGEDAIDVLNRVRVLRRGTVDLDLIRHLQDNLRHAVVRYETLDHHVIAASLLKQRAWIDTLLVDCSHPKQRQQLFEIAGATAGVLGYIAVGRSEFPLARAYCLESFHLADFAEDAKLQAWARGLQSFCEYYAGRYEDALALAQDGLRYADSGPQSVRLTINGMARAMGKLGDVEGVHRAVGEAYELMSRNDVPGGVPSSISFDCYSAAQTASNAATAYVSLGISDKVRHYINIALPDINKSGSPWSRSLVMIDLACSLIRSRQADLDHATALVLDAQEVSAGRPIVSVRQRTGEFLQLVRDRYGQVPEIGAIHEAASVPAAR